MTEVNIEDLLRERILVLDGAMGTQIQALDLTADDFGGPELEGCNENLVLTRPAAIRGIHEAYLEAGADIVETNTFGGTRIVLAEYGLEDKVREINRVAAGLAREAVDRYSTPERPRYVAGSLGPGTKTICVTGGVTFDEVLEAYKEQALGLLEGGSDLLLLETVQDTLNLKAAALGILEARDELGIQAPLMLSVTIEPMGSMLAGQGIEALHASVEHLPLLSIGLNCATGPEFMTDHLRSLSGLSTGFVSVYPNAGLPNEEGEYDETPTTLSQKLLRFIDEGWVNVVGGCCGTTPEHIREIAKLVEGKKPRVPARDIEPAVSGIDYLLVEDENRPVLVGERTNVIGSRKFKRLIVEEKFEEASEVGRGQVRGGAQVLDVCMANPDRDERADMEKLLGFLTRKVKLPIMIDSTDSEVIETSLKLCQGKCIINSINLEDGEERFEDVVPLIKRYGQAVIVGCIDEDPEQGMGVTRERKLAIARRSYELLTGKFGLPGRDIIFDPLVFPCGTGDENYIGSAVETIEGLKLIKEALPDTKTVLGISNVSFGLPPAGREVLNSVFLYHCVQAGLDYALVNTEKIERYPSIPEEERKLAEDLIFWRGEDPVAAFAAHFKGKTGRAKVEKASLTLDERLANYVLEGSKDGLIEDLDLAMKERPPLEIINGPLMAGMDEVGRLFNKNELIVAEVLQSAESMKAAVAHLEPFMEKSDAANRGKVLLATVKGDVHDIGKNLVDIIFSNNGYSVVNLGIKIPPEALIAACEKESPDVIGLSGLLVKSAQQMVITAEDLRNANIDVPMMVGGAALSRRFTDLKIAAKYGGPVLYASDAMNGLDTLHRLMAEGGRTTLLAETRARQEALQSGDEGASRPRATVEAPGRSDVDRSVPVLPAPHFERTAIEPPALAELFPLINPSMLYGKHLGLRGNLEKLLASGDETATKLHGQVRDFLAEAEAESYLRPRGVFQFFRASAAGNRLDIHDGDARLESFDFPRQKKAPHLCLSDFCREEGEDERDVVAMFVVTCGDSVRERALEWKEKGEYLRSHLLSAVAIESAEAMAEWLHRDLRRQWGFPDPDGFGPQDLFKARYRGIRVSFGYPACPDLSDQRKLFRLLDAPAEVGVRLTDGDMMDPEASVSALVFHHPEARYFSAHGGPDDE